jgi:hypothetical protein
VPGNSDQKDETKPQSLVDCARADVDGVVTLPIQGVADRKEAEAPSSAEASPGLAARSSLRLCPGDPGGVGGSRSDGPTTARLPDPARAIRDGRHILSFSGTDSAGAEKRHGLCY